jgi:hypothetical protein
MHGFVRISLIFMGIVGFASVAQGKCAQKFVPLGARGSRADFDSIKKER